MSSRKNIGKVPFMTPKNKYLLLHYSLAVTDTKIVILRQKKGFEGIGLYWGIAELINYWGGLKVKENGYELLADTLKVDISLIEEMVKDLLEIELLKSDGIYINNFYADEMERIDDSDEGILGHKVGCRVKR